MNKVALITGASSGIGYATAILLAKNGWHIVGMARRAERLEALSHAIEALPAPHGAFLPSIGDVTKAEDVAQAVKLAESTWGRLDATIANAGIGQRGAVVDTQWEDLDTLLRTNIDGVMHSIRASVPLMRHNGSGHLVIISSVAASLVSPYAATYAASKAFVSSLAQSLRLELSQDKIRVTDMLVGRTETEFNEKRLGEGKRTASNLPAMPAEKVAEGILNALQRPRDTVILRPFDRLIVLGNRLVPSLMGYLAKKQYQ